MHLTAEKQLEFLCSSRHIWRVLTISISVKTHGLLLVWCQPQQAAAEGERLLPTKYKLANLGYQAISTLRLLPVGDHGIATL